MDEVHTGEMSMASLFINQDEAQAYAAALTDTSERVWTQFVISRTIGAIIADPNSRDHLMQHPFDLLAQARIAHALIRDRSLITRILGGEFQDFSDIADLF
jgi:hypothetical protein